MAKMMNYPDHAMKRIEKIIESTPTARRPLMKRVFNGKPSLRMAVKAKCFECCGFENIVQNVYGCQSFGCPLWRLRPQPNLRESKQDVTSPPKENE